MWRRLQNDLKAGRYPQAFELARQLHTQQPSNESLSGLSHALMGLVHQALHQDRIGEAQRHLDEAEKLDSRSLPWFEQLGMLRAKCGDWRGAQRLLDRVPETTLRPKALGFVVDRAIRDPKNGRSILPGELHAGLDTVIAAFAHYSKGEDEAARNALQSIGVQSPFLDWKLLVRGLMAHAVNDDPRAIENWQRLDKDRMPAQIAGPLRFQIDPAYRATLPAEQVKRLAARSDQLTLPMLSSLRKVQRVLSTPENLHEALRQVRPLVGMLKMSAPAQFPRLLNCFYWMIIQGGQPEDMEEFREVFGKPPDDPDFSRLIALATESVRRFDQANKEWKQYADWIASQPQRFPGEFGRRARATIALRMGDNALENEEAGGDDFTPESFFDFINQQLQGRGGRKKPLKPSAEECYRKAVELAPDWKEPLLRLLDLYIEEENWTAAEPIGRRLVERCPDDAEVLVKVSDVLHAVEKDDEALEVLRAALKHHPLDTTLRGVVAQMTIRRGRRLSLAGDFDAARTTLNEALQLDPEMTGPVTRAALAACEFKAGREDEARRLAAELQAAPKRRVAAAFLLMAETLRIKPHKSITADYKKAFEDVLRGEIEIQELFHLLMALQLFRTEEDRYYGFGAHEKKILGRIQQLIAGNLPEADLARLGIILVEARMHKPLKVLAEQGLQRFPKSPAFPFLQAQHMMLQRPKSFDMYRVAFLFGRSMEMIEKEQAPLNTVIREMIDRVCKEHPQLAGMIERNRGYQQQFGDPFDDEDWL